MQPRIRLLALGNELLADDAVGLAVADQVRRAMPELEVVSAAAGGLALMDLILDADRLIVVDALLSGTAAAGTIHVIREDEVRVAFGPSPHYTGLWEVLALGRALGLAVPRDVVIVAVEAADCGTMGGTMHPSVRGAVGEAARLIRDCVAGWRNGGDGRA
ncbi:MAG TPA: hydrogenase maturation protease [Gemmatimonadales bacterium]|nr:hydrogenase maturation protease [Gemmatimonadales bacterium]